MEELVSVIVPVYNIEDYLPRCLACIEMQTYKNMEIILVDDGSTDGSGRLCDEFAAKDSRARVIHHSENKGLWAARNTGQDAAMGEYIWMPDGDDYFHKDIVKVMHEAINCKNDEGEKFDMAIVKHKQTSMFDEDIISEIQPAFVKKALEEVLEVFVRPDDHFTGRNVWNKLCRKELINNIRTGNYKYAQDCDFSLKVYLKSPKIVYVDNIMYYFVDRASSARFKPDHPLISNICVIRLLYNNYISQKKIQACCQRYILEDLYIRMAVFLDDLRGNSTRQECNNILRNTYADYIKCNSIKTFKYRVLRVLRIRFNKLYNRWMRMR